MKAKAFNTQTGLFYVVGKGFVEECLHRATTLDAPELAVVRATFLNVGELKSNNGGHASDWPACECEKCAE